MANDIKRRDFVKGAAGLGTLIGSDLLLGCAAVKLKPGGTAGVRYFQQFGIDEGVLRQVLAAALTTGGDYADVFFQHRVTHSLALEDKEVKRARTDVELGAGVRVLKGDQTGYAFTEDLSVEALRRAALTAASIANGPARAGPVSFQMPSDLPQRYRTPLAWSKVTAAERIGVLERASEGMLSGDPRVLRAKVAFDDQQGVILVADSTGRVVEDAQPMTTLRLACIAQQADRLEENYASVGARAGFDLYTPARIDGLARDAVARTLVLFEAVPSSVGEMPVVLGSGTTGVLLHEAIGHGMEADFNRTARSVFSDKIGKKVAHPFVNIVDDGTQEGYRGALNVDDEGNIAGKTQLVENGVLASYLHDRISARHYKLPTTGSGRRESYRFVPLPRMRSTYMLPGPHRPEELIASVSKGIYCERLSNGQVNIGPGDFSFYVKNGYLIENGKLTRPIKDVNLIGNGPKVLEQLDMVADDLLVASETYTCGKDGQSVPVSVGMPSVRVASMTVGGRAAQGA